MLALGWADRNAGALDEAEGWIRKAIEAFDDLGDRIGSPAARHTLTFILLARGKYEEASEVCKQSLALWKEVGSDWGAGKAWWHLAAASAMNGDYDEAEIAAARSLELFEGFDDPGAVVHVRAVQGDAARLAGRWERSELIYRKCLAGFQDVGDRRCTASTLKNLGLAILHLDRVEDGVRLLTAALERRNELNDSAGVLECLEGLALVAIRRGDDPLAVRLLASADRLRSSTGATSPEPEREEIAAALVELRAKLPPPRFEDTWNEGLRMSTDLTIGAARRLLGEVTEDRVDPGHLTEAS
jgi:tetratricopeptide (TPR) repeat protein